MRFNSSMKKVLDSIRMESVWSQEDYTMLEWDGNEVIINDSANILSMIIYALGIVTAWKKQMETDSRILHLIFYSPLTMVVMV